jgi:hypothetical protein
MLAFAAAAAAAADYFLYRRKPYSPAYVLYL